ncbi:PREDICTED: CASP-like protein 2D1 [Tarenaya hassleriana]|uniref:CASP-like protein 2D1 n=1 Tax=Tarenaya hassleriana TaxID=28532 RepID=UPI00053C9842|nr:PREDICTED: CASP-like protein 2D1 [Tarenaya hassleriana]
MRENTSEEGSSSSKQPPVLKMIDSCLRLSVVPLSVATVWLTVTNHQDNPDYGNLDYTNLFGLKYMAGVSAVCAAYAVVSCISSWVICFVSRSWLFFLSDQVLAYLTVTSMAAASEITYLAYKGDRQVTWSEVCSSYAGFCSKLAVALGLHAFVVVFFFLLSAISAYRIFKTFEPPHLS